MEADCLRRLRDLLRPGHELTLGHEQPGARLCTLYRIRGHQASPDGISQRSKWIKTRQSILGSNCFTLTLVLKLYQEKKIVSSWDMCF